MIRNLAVLAAAALSFAVTAPAAVVVNVLQQGSDVVVTASGTLDLSNLTKDSYPYSNDPLIWPDFNAFVVGASAPGDGYYDNLLVSRWRGFGGVGDYSSFSPTTASGDTLGVFGPDILVPRDYVNGSQLSSGMVFAGTTIADLKLTEGTVVVSWGIDSMTFNIGSQVPEPGTMGLLGVAGLALLARAYRRSV